MTNFYHGDTDYLARPCGKGNKNLLSQHLVTKKIVTRIELINAEK